MKTDILYNAKRDTVIVAHGLHMRVELDVRSQHKLLGMLEHGGERIVLQAEDHMIWRVQFLKGGLSFTAMKGGSFTVSKASVPALERLLKMLVMHAHPEQDQPERR